MKLAFATSVMLAVCFTMVYLCLRLIKPQINPDQQLDFPRDFYVPILATTPKGLILTHVYIRMWHVPVGSGEGDAMTQQARDTFFGTNAGNVEIVGRPWPLCISY